MASAALGLEPNTVQQQAFLIPYKKSVPLKDDNGRNAVDANGKWIWVETYECQFQVGYRGFITLAHRSEYIQSIEAETIHENDHFKHMKGSNAFLEYEKTLRDRGEPIGAYCFTKLESGIEVATVLPIDEIYKIRGRSETYKSLVRGVENAKDKDRAKAEDKLFETPWVMWFDDMGAKSAIKKHAKQLPLTPGDSLSAAAAIDSSADTNTIDMGAMADPDMARSVVNDGMDPPAAIEHSPTETAEFKFPPDQKEAVARTEEQPRTGARQAKPKAEPAQSLGSASEAPTYMNVVKSLRDAKTLDGLDLAADLIRDVEDDNERGDLEHIYGQRRAEIETPTTKPARRASNVSME
jgi:recombination protein RecT